MRKWLVALLVSLVATSVSAATRLHIKAGAVHSLPANTAHWQLDELVMENGATLLLPAMLGPVRIEVARAELGEQVRILAAGKEGNSGAAGRTVADQAEKCRNGTAGGQGGQGSVGQDGVSLELVLHLARLGSLQIDAQGGAGGEGGAGGKGQDAGEIDNCPAPTGGAGGNGGNGGHGGAGGHVQVHYSQLPGSAIAGIAQRIQVNAAGGEGGSGGVAGKGGEGGPGKFITMKTLSGNKKWVAGGEDGAVGAAGTTGRDGLQGQVQIQEKPAARVNALPQLQSQEERINRLENQLHRMQQQLEQLEATLDAVTRSSEVPSPAAP